MTDKSRHTLGWALALLFAVAMLLGAGPGTLLINRPEPILGLPALYVWGLGCYAIQVFVVVMAYVFVWRNEDDTPTDKS